MKKRGFRAFFNLLALATAMAFALTLFIFSIDAIETTRTGQLPRASSEAGLRIYAEKISDYSLVLSGLLDPSTEIINLTGPLHSCLGLLRYRRDDLYIDISALTLSIISNEMYNRGPLRRLAEMYFEDIILLFGWKTDLTTGIAQIRASLAERIYREKINPAASQEAIKQYNRSDCGSARLAAFHVQDLVALCGQNSKVQGLGDTLICVIEKYTGMSAKSRQGKIYIATAARSYSKVFDDGNEWYYEFYLNRLGLGSVEAGECLEFNSGRPQLSKPPSDKSFYQANAPRGDISLKREQIVINGERITYNSPARVAGRGAIKIISTDQDAGFNNKPSLSLSLERRRIAAKYACNKYNVESVEFSLRPEMMPRRLDRYCTGGDQEPEPEQYLLLYGTEEHPKAAFETVKCVR